MPMTWPSTPPHLPSRLQNCEQDRYHTHNTRTHTLTPKRANECDKRLPLALQSADRQPLASSCWPKRARALACGGQNNVNRLLPRSATARLMRYTISQREHISKRYKNSPSLPSNSVCRRSLYARTPAEQDRSNEPASQRSAVCEQSGKSPPLEDLASEQKQEVSGSSKAIQTGKVFPSAAAKRRGWMSG